MCGECVGAYKQESHKNFDGDKNVHQTDDCGSRDGPFYLAAWSLLLPGLPISEFSLGCKPRMTKGAPSFSSSHCWQLRKLEIVSPSGGSITNIVTSLLPSKYSSLATLPPSPPPPLIRKIICPVKCSMWINNCNKVLS